MALCLHGYLIKYLSPIKLIGVHYLMANVGRLHDRIDKLFQERGRIKACCLIIEFLININ